MHASSLWSAFVGVQVSILGLSCGVALAQSADPAARTAARRALCDDLTAFAQRELADKRVPSIGIELLDVDPATGDEWSWAIALGHDAPPDSPNDPTGERARRGADVDGVVRAASIGKVVTATMAMVLAARGQLDLDAPVVRYLPEFAPGDARAAEITLRHLLLHRSGLPRECPVGNWYDASAPDLAATVRSLDGLPLRFAPGAGAVYSNPGYAVAGRVLEVVGGRSFAALADDLVFAPLGLRDTSFAPSAEQRARTRIGRMWTLDGRAIPTPDYEFGCGPALNLRSTTGDLVRLARSWLPHSERRVLTPLQQAAMWQGHADAPGNGLGFQLGQLDGALRVGHSGTAPGTASELAALPDEGLVVAVVVALDFANDLAEAIAARALRGMRALRCGAALAPATYPEPLGVAMARSFAGRYGAGDEWFDLLERDGDLVFDPCIGIASVQRRRGEDWIADDPCAIGGRVLRPGRGRRVFDGWSWFVPRPQRAPATPPAELVPLLGEYGWDHGGLIVYEDEGKLGVLFEWHVRELPDRLGPDRYEFPPGSLGGETLQFVRAADGRVTAAICANVTMPRRPDPAPGGFRIRPQRPIAELRAEAARATPPAQPAGLREPDLLPLASVSPSLKFDVRYATPDNFLGEAVYEIAAPSLQRPAALALAAAHARLAPLGYGIVVHDAYRPWSVTKVFWDATPPELREFVADPARGSRHNRGCAVDVSLYDLDTGLPVPMPSDYDEFTPRAYPDWPGGTAQQRFFRDLLRATMADCGFTVYEHEWWHYDHRDWQQYPVLDVPLR